MFQIPVELPQFPREHTRTHSSQPGPRTSSRANLSLSAVARAFQPHPLSGVYSGRRHFVAIALSKEGKIGGVTSGAATTFATGKRRASPQHWRAFTIPRDARNGPCVSSGPQADLSPWHRSPLASSSVLSTSCTAARLFTGSGSSSSLSRNRNQSTKSPCDAMNPLI
jgi:hypothetical protein